MYNKLNFETSMVACRGTTRILSYRRLSRFSHLNVSILVPLVLLSGALYFIYNGYHEKTWRFLQEWRNGKNQIVMDLSKNYFRSAIEVARDKFLVNNDQCKIPDLNTLDSSVIPFFKVVSPTKCHFEFANLTYVKDQSLIINENALKTMGYQSLSDVSCCYRVIHRIEQTDLRFNKDADNNFRLSKKCYPMSRTTQPHEAFIRVVCRGSSSFMKSQVIYKKTHVIAKFPENSTKTSLSRKIDFWKKCATGVKKSTLRTSYCDHIELNGHPPNILLIGIDSTSRLNFHRQLPQTVKVLEKRLGAIEMNGYTKVGENTFPNFVPLMTSYSEQELKKVCYPNRWIPQDKCPYIWKHFSKRNYLTAHLEDSPQMAIFNYLKTGFIRSPVDIYLRPFMLAAYKDKDNAWSVDCLGNQRPEEIILDYVVDLVTLSHAQGIPYFITSWLTDLSHEDMNNIQTMDFLLANTLLKLKISGLLDNTVLFVMSDHGYRYADVRATTSGWYEDKLPALFVKLPENMKKRHPTWKEGLEHNSRQLTTPFDIHATLAQILHSVSMPAIMSSNSTKNELPQTTSQSTPELIMSSESSLRGLSLLQKLPIRSCDEAGVPKEYCACTSPIAFTNLTLIRLGAEAVVRKINTIIPTRVCTKLQIDSIIAAGVIPSSKSNLQSSSTKSTRKNHNHTNFVIALKTKPGAFRFEALVTYDNVLGRFSEVSNILRTNKKDSWTGCLNDRQVSAELFCVCKSGQWWPF